MAAFTVSTNTNFDDAALLPMVNGDTITITSGARLTINSDPQTGKNGAYLSTITVTEGEVFVDGTTVRQFTYGTAAILPVVGDICTCTATGASGEVIAITGTITAGTIKLRSVTGGTGVISATAVTFTGNKTATASSVDVVSWLLVVGMESTGIGLASRLGTMRMRGTWYVLGTSTGAAAQTFQHYTTDILPAVWVETGSGTNVYEIWLNAGSRWAAGISNGERGKFFSMANGNATITFATATIIAAIPPNGARIRVPNVHLASVAAAAANATTRVVNAVLATRYGTLVSGPGNIFMDTVVGAGFYLNATGAGIVDVRNTGMLHAIFLSNITNYAFITGLALGQTTTTNYTPITVQNSTASSSTLTAADYIQILASSVTNYLALTTGSVVVTNSQNVTLGVAVSAFARAAVAVDAIRVANSFRVMLTGCSVAGARLHVTASDDVVVTNLRVSDTAQGANVTTFPLSAVVVDGGCASFKLDGLAPMTGGTQPFTSWVNLSGAANPKIRNIGTQAAPLAGAAQTGFFLELAGLVVGLEAARVYAAGLRLGSFSSSAGTTASNTAISLLNFNADPTGTFQPVFNDGAIKGCRITGVVKIDTPALCDGNHFYDLFTTDTTGLIGFIFQEASLTPLSMGSYAVLAGTPVFDGKGKLLLRTAGDQIEYTSPYSVLGYTAFANLTFNVTGTTITNLSYDYKLDRNTGTFDATWKPYSAAAISAEAIVPAGFKIKFRFTAASTLSTSSLTAFSLPMVTTLAAQTSNLYPLDVVAGAANPRIMLSNLKPNSEVHIYRLSDSVELATVENSTDTFTYTYMYSADVAVYIVVLNVQYDYLRLDNILLNATGNSIRILQRFDNIY